MKPTDFIVKTIVTTEVIREIAEKNHIEMRDCYTGFKWIAREIKLSEGKQQYIGGGEESYGFLLFYYRRRHVVAERHAYARHLQL